ncbi:hypothetical protein [Marinobacterium lutimaris]|uniref:Uncharacterized protein n=1 Tax=Marinobacterium lutimaris TaxID=568106 RepID=A0A1H5Y9Y5_9GAMM|nr:hypothetical protein [Marinobacterium lutimaris]SEG20863.1 hypothetical protein SAMN05444390_1011679 [Marinobacterium lutimaris]
MAIEESLRARINKLVEVYVGWVRQGPDPAGWHQPNSIQVWRDHKGFLPERSGMDRSNDKAIYESLFVREQHALFERAIFMFGRPSVCPDCRGVAHDDHCCVRCSGFQFVLAKGKVPDRYTVAILANEYYRDWTQPQIAAHFGLTLKAYEGRLTKAREIVALELLALDDYEAIKTELNAGALAMG